MILGKVELLVMAILLSKNIAQCDDRAARRPSGVTTERRDDRAAVGWAWTGRNLILDEALYIYIYIYIYILNVFIYLLFVLYSALV